MKQFITLSVTAFLAFSAPVLAQPAPPTASELHKSIQTKIQEKKYAEAVTQIESALQTPDLSAPDKVRFLKAAAQANMSQGRARIPDAIAFHERIVADASLPNSARIEALQNIANAQIAMLAGLDLFEMDLSKAHATLKRGLDLPGLNPEDRALALINIGRLYEREDKTDDARKIYQQVLAFEVSERTKTNVQRQLADILVVEGRDEEAIALYRENNWDLIGLYQKLGDSTKRDEETTKFLTDIRIAENVRWNQFNRLPVWDAKPKDMTAIRAAWDAYMPAFLEKDVNRVTFIQRKVVDANAEPEFVVWAAPLVLQAPKLSVNEIAAIKSAQMEALAATGKVAELVRESTAFASEERFAAPARLWARLISVCAERANSAAVAKAVQEAGAIAEKEKAEAIVRAANTVLRTGNTEAGRGLYAAYQGRLATQQRAAIIAEFIADAPYDVGSWLASPLVKTPGAKLNRPYGDNLEFLLLTDSAMTGRNTSAQAKEATGDTDTDFYVASDVEGVHFFFNAHDSRVAEVVDGLLGGGSFEMYLAPGAQQAYHTFLIDMPKGGADPAGFITMYPNRTFRQPSLKGGTLRTQTRATNKGLATYLFLSWELFYDKLPVNGSKWQFEAIRWTRAGGFSFGGSESVHNRSSWGDVVFSGLTAANLHAIKRGIIFKAVDRYRKARKPVGALGAWADPKLADPEFYVAQVEPMLKKLDAYAEKVNKDMTVADVDMLYREAVPGWMGGNFEIQAMRAQYLLEKHFR